MIQGFISSISIIHLILFLSVCSFLTTLTLSQPVVTIDVNWNRTLLRTKTTTTLQLVVNPLVRRESPIHDNIFQNLQNLNLDYARFVPWFPYPRLSVAELDPPSGLSQCGIAHENGNVTLSCKKAGSVINKIEFADYGTSTGRCNNFTLGTCSSKNSSDIISQVCLGQQNCSVNSTWLTFGDPCYGTVKRLAIQITCSIPQNNTYWDFKALDETMLDFLYATEAHPRIPNFSTQPKWLYEQASDSDYDYPDDVNGEDWSYPSGNILKDPTCQQIGEYYGRLVSWYTNGGFYDEYGYYHRSNHYQNITHWEVLNEVDSEHFNTIEQYVCIYDSIVTHIREMADPKHQIEFVGLALASRNTNFISYFLNSSNHKPNIPLDWISYHFYSSPSDRYNATTYEAMFGQTDAFYKEVIEIEAIRQKLSPTTKTTIDELGVILPNDNSDVPVFPPIFWNAAASAFAYAFARISLLEIDVIGHSQLVGYPQLFNIMGEETLPPQYPSVALLDWKSGNGTAKYWVLDLIHKHFPADVIAVETNSSDDTLVYAQGYLNDFGSEILLLNKKYSPFVVSLPFQTGLVRVLDLSTGFNPPRQYNMNNGSVYLSEFAVAIVTKESPSALLSVSNE